MNKKLAITIGLIIGVFTCNGLLGQETEDYPVIPPFETISLIDNQTTVNLYKGSLNLEIQHRFSQIKSISDLFGIYGTANSRLALHYGITDKIQVGFGTTRNSKLQDLSWKYSILTQTESGKIPVSLSYYGNAVLDAREDAAFGPPEDYKFIHRFSYLTQLIVSRRFGEKISMQVAPSFIWLNSAPEGYNNINFSVNAGLRAQVLGFHSIVLEYEQPLNTPEAFDVYPNLALGVEIGTSTHAFRVFVSNYNALVKNYNVVYNTNNPFDFSESNYQFGFNIAIRF